MLRDSRRRADVATSPERVSLQVAAAILGVSTKTVRRYIADGRLPAERVADRLLRVRRDDVEALVQPVPTVESA